jgi:iron-sulfur cluster repair protein YtfE (RIC family)
MTPPARTIQEEHEAFRPQLEAILRLADAIEETPADELRAAVREVDEFLAHSVMPHAVAEGRVLIPLVRREGAEPKIGVRMTACHDQIGRLLDELEALVPTLEGSTISKGAQRDLRRILYSTHALLEGHLAEVDADLEPLLEAKLPPEQREALFEAVERCAREVARAYER